MSELISVSELKQILRDTKTLVLDCRSDLSDRQKSRALYQQDHITGALFAHLEEDLSGAVKPSITGRHPLPLVKDFELTLQNWGITNEHTIVVYDQLNSMFAARAWWLLKWAGLNNVKVLNGGYQAWLAEDGTTDAKAPLVSPSHFSISPNNQWVVNADTLVTEPEKYLILDARTLNRYRGDLEPLDAKAGHIPGAIGADSTKNLKSDGLFIPATELKNRFALAAEKPTICYCGSGVTACHNILAIVEAGYPMPKLYPGSWSEWITDKNRRIAIGSEGAI